MSGDKTGAEELQKDGMNNYNDYLAGNEFQPFIYHPDMGAFRVWPKFV